MRLLQVCNVGNIVGGTAACAWSTTRALPDWEHVVWFRGRPTAETHEAFRGCRIEQGSVLSESKLRELAADIVLLHNTPAQAVPWGEGCPGQTGGVLHYRHSAGGVAAGADARLVCSRFLQQQLGVQDALVLNQGVPCPAYVSGPDVRGIMDRLRVGRLCTPTGRKWPTSLLDFYGKLAERHPEVDWEFVGCPASLQSRLEECLRGRVCFFPAGWGARSRMHGWHALLYSQPEYPESFGRVCAEAMRCGCVPIVDRLGGFVEQVTEGTGWLCADGEQFSEALGALCEPGRWRDRSRRCRETAESRFSHRAYRNGLLNAMSLLFCK